MKTTKIISALSIALILLGTNFLFAASPINGKKTLGGINLIRYQVSVHVPSDIKLCNLWVVEITDAKGNTVAPAQVFIPGNTSYIFYEKGPVTGVRIATMAFAQTMHYNCEAEFNVAPDVKSGTFHIGETVNFLLIPAMNRVAEKN